MHRIAESALSGVCLRNFVSRFAPTLSTSFGRRRAGAYLDLPDYRVEGQSQQSGAVTGPDLQFSVAVFPLQGT